MPTPRQVNALQRRVAKERFLKARRVEKQYARQLIAVGRHCGEIVLGFTAQKRVTNFDLLRQSLSDYAELLTPWATSISQRMHADVNQKDLVAWRQLSQSIGAGLERELNSAPTGQIMQQLMREQVTLIRSIPLDAAQRVHDLTTTSLVEGRRAEDIFKEIQATGQTSAYGAYRIARTETSRTATALCQARATWVGSSEYIWHANGDVDTRPLHMKLDGTTQRWDSPPVTGNKGERSHPGSIYFCRCWPEPILPDPPSF